jgi:hypothetical protein
MVLYINTDNSWSSVKASYLISSRKDFILGSFVSEISDLGNTGASSKIIEHAIVDCTIFKRPSKNMKLIYLISGLKTADNSFNIDLSENKFINGKISVKVSTDASPAIELIYITYVIFEEAAPFTFQTYNPSSNVVNANYIFEGIDQINGNLIVTFGYGFNSNLPTISNLNCVGSLCSAQCITQYNCSANKGVILQRNCYLCGNGQIYSNGQCVNNCAQN